MATDIGLLAGALLKEYLGSGNCASLTDAELKRRIQEQLSTMEARGQFEELRSLRKLIENKNAEERKEQEEEKLKAEVKQLRVQVEQLMKEKETSDTATNLLKLLAEGMEKQQLSLQSSHQNQHYQ